MMSFFTPDVHRSELIYFLNEKENAIAPKITDKGASAVKNQIDAGICPQRCGNRI